MIQCANCGAYGDAASNFCTYCGSRLVAATNQDNKQADAYVNSTSPYYEQNQYQDYAQHSGNNQYGAQSSDYSQYDEHGEYSQYRHTDNYPQNQPRKKRNSIIWILVLIFGAVAIAIFGAAIIFFTRNIISDSSNSFTGEAGNVAAVINSIEEDINNKDWSAAAENFTAELAYNFEYIAFIEHQTGDYLNIFDREHYSDEELAELDSTVIGINIEDIEINGDMAVASGTLRRTYQDLYSDSFTDIEQITFNLVKVDGVWLVDAIPYMQ